MTDPDFARLMLCTALNNRVIDGESARLIGRRIGDAKSAAELLALPVQLPHREQSNSNAVFGEQIILKLYRRLGEGINPELEVGEHLTARAHFANTAPLAGAIEFAGRGHPPQTLGVLLTYLHNEGDAWAHFLDHGQRYFEALDALEAEKAALLCLPGDPGCTGGDDGPPAEIIALIAEPLELSRLLGRRTAEMHAALADDQGDPAFAPEPYGMTYQRSLLQSMRNTTHSTMQTLSRRLPSLSDDARTLAQSLNDRQADILRIFHELTSHPIRTVRIRCHGDYHLGQVLWTGRDFVIIDFEGEPLRSVGERRLKRSALKDVAGMVRSFDYAAWTALRRHGELFHPQPNPAARDREVRGASIWGGWLSREFVRAYTSRARELCPDLLPANLADTELLLRTWVLEKALYEVRYELNSRPDWAEIPMRAALTIIEGKFNATSAAKT